MRNCSIITKLLLVDMIIILLMVLVLFLFSGCSAKFVWTDDVVGYSGSLCSWGKVDDLSVDVNDTQILAGGSEYRPDANSIKAVGRLAGNAFKEILK